MRLELLEAAAYTSGVAEDLTDRDPDAAIAANTIATLSFPPPPPLPLLPLRGPKPVIMLGAWDTVAGGPNPPTLLLPGTEPPPSLDIQAGAIAPLPRPAIR